MGNQEVTQDFVDKVQWLHEVEYGDFKRKLGLYISRLIENLDTSSSEAKVLISKMRHLVVYQPSGNIEETRVQAVDLAKKLKTLV